MSLAIRRAPPDQAGLVFALIRELAEYEKLLHEVEATEADIGAALASVAFAAQPWVVEGVEFRLRALPKGRDTRGSSELWGNPFPAVAFWTGQ